MTSHRIIYSCGCVFYKIDAHGRNGELMQQANGEHANVQHTSDASIAGSAESADLDSQDMGSGPCLAAGATKARDLHW